MVLFASVVGLIDMLRASTCCSWIRFIPHYLIVSHAMTIERFFFFFKEKKKVKHQQHLGQESAYNKFDQI
jgi:hypothetical protein